ncbi:unnamed protein product [Mytilus coruscus]|uniref:LRAT domain-containing protein n=1 Tax=Mytilus coruscus TaxID=42192 RepID=A0A6J8C6Y2_MYTCO|nr:unnamed protein product [Mytilus coruscus]
MGWASAQHAGLLPDYDTDDDSTYDELSNDFTEDSTSLTGLLPDHSTNDECAYDELPYFTEDSTSLKDISSSKGDIKEIKAQRWKVKVNSLTSVKSGDDICFKRKAGLYKHHALVSAVNTEKKRFKVIELSGDSIDCMLASSSSCPKGSVFETAIDFDKCTKMYKYYYNSQRKDGLHAVEVARIFVDEGLPNNYHLKSFNCEHFVSYCITGIPFSKQTRSTNKEAGRLLDDIVKKHRHRSLQEGRSSSAVSLEETSYLLMDGCATVYMNANPECNDGGRYSELQRISCAQRDSSYSGYTEPDYLNPCYGNGTAYHLNNPYYYHSGGFMY